MADFTDRGIDSLKPSERPYYVNVADAKHPGLALRVAPDGKKTWSLRYRVGRRQRRLTLGTYPIFGLADARKGVRDALKQVQAGADPQATKQDRRDADTFEDFAKVYIEKYAQPRKRTWKIDQMRLNKDVLPVWKHHLVRDITRRDVRDLLDTIGARRAKVVANRVRSLLHKLFNFAIQRDAVEVNPVSGTEKIGVETQRDRVLTHDEVRVVWKTAETFPLEMKAAWQIRLLTAQRGGEVYGMQWQDVDLTTGWWTIPAAGSKNKKAHRVPLSAPVLDLLAQLKAKADEALKKHPESKRAVYVLRNARGKRQQAQAAEVFGIEDFRGHDLRRTAASLMASSGVPRLVISMILNHAQSGVTAVYDRHSYDPEKRIALDSWARQLTTIIEQEDGANVLAFAARG